VSFRTTNTIQNHLKPKEKTIDAYNQSGVYQLKCNDCPLKYVGQTGRIFKVRYKEHIQAIKTKDKKNSNYAQHILDTEYTNGTAYQTLEILHTEKKGQSLNTLERFQIYI
jgi:hypothetical protein